MKRMDLTNRQREILDFIKSHIDSCGYPPTVREIGEACGLRSPRSVSQYLESLEKKGFLRRDREKSRAMELLIGPGEGGEGASTDIPVSSTPLLGDVPAGDPSLAVEARDGAYYLDKRLFGGDESFLLRARGKSMVGAHIMDGDLLVVRRGEQALDGDIVVAMVGEEATVKRLVRNGREVLLVPENDAMDAIDLGRCGEEVRVLGKVVGVIRRIK